MPLFFFLVFSSLVIELKGAFTVAKSGNLLQYRSLQRLGATNEREIFDKFRILKLSIFFPVLGVENDRDEFTPPIKHDTDVKCFPNIDNFPVSLVLGPV